MASSTLDRMIAILTKQTGTDAATVTGETSLEALGIDSFDFIEFLFLVEDEFNVTIEAHFTDIGTRLKTVSDVANAVEELMREKQSGKDAAAIDMAGPAVHA